MSKLFALSVSIIVYACCAHDMHSYADGAVILGSLGAGMVAFSAVRGFVWLLNHE